MVRVFAFIFVNICLSVCFVSCKKDKLLTDPSARVSFSQDSILFDTVFTTIGSATRSMRVINKNNQKINISSVRLQNGPSSQFMLNVDGVPGKQVNDVEILANDSIYIFVQVNVNPTSALSPLIIQDKILFDVNGNQQEVPLEAWGQDAHYHFPNQAIQYKNGFLPYSTVSSQTTAVTVTWGGGALGQPDDNRPHVVYGWLVVDSAQTLVINPGVKVYFHQNAGLWTYRYGTLQVNGAQGNEVIFQGDRREADYADLPGQWDRIWINEGSKNNYINYAIIKNSYIGIQASLFPFFIPPNTIAYDVNAPKYLKITNTIIKNCSSQGIYTQHFNVWGANDVVCNCKEYCGVFTWGGNTTFLHSTFANYFNQDGGRGGQPSVHIDNYDGTNTWECDSVYFANSIISGSQSNEFEYDLRPNASSPSPKYLISHSLLRATPITGTVMTNTANDFTGNPEFKDIDNYDFGIKANSAARGIGSPAVISSHPSILFNDIKGSSRGAAIDAGAYQY